MGRRALEGVRVLDLTQIWAGPYCCRLLADMGAEVIKIEAARRYDGSRTYGVLAQGSEDSPPWERRALFNHKHRGKLGITIDMTAEKGVALFLRLLQLSDIVVENFSARVMGNWGLDYPVLQRHKPDIIMISMPAFGMTGPERDYVGQGSNLSPLSGLVALTGYIGGQPQNVGAYTDPIAGVTAAGALMAALYCRAQTGTGQYIDLSQREAGARLIGDAIMDFTMNGRVWPAMGNRSPHFAPQGCYPCAGEDKWVAISVTSEGEWRALCEAAGHPEWASDIRFRDAACRQRNHDALDGLLASWTAQHEAGAVMRQLQARGVAAGAVYAVPEMLEDPHLQARGYLPEVHHPQSGTFPNLGVYAKLSRTPGHIARGRPTLGQHNQYVFQSVLGLADAEVGALLSEGVIENDPAKVRA